MNEIRDVRKKGWFWIENILIDREDLSPYEKLLYMTLARFSDETGKSFPGLEKLIRITGIKNKKTIVKYLRELELKGLIKIIKSNGRGNIYYLKNADSKPVPADTPVPKNTSGKKYPTPVPADTPHQCQQIHPKETQEGNTLKKTQYKEKDKKEKPQNGIEVFVNELEKPDEYKSLILEYLKFRKEIKKPVKTTKPLAKIVSDFPSVYKLREAVEIAKIKEWQGLEPEWIENYKKSKNGGNSNANNSGNSRKKGNAKGTGYKPDYSKPW